MGNYQSELLVTHNKVTGNTRYFVKKCDVFSRISKSEYANREDYSHRSDTFKTVSDANHVRQYKTIYLRG